MDLEKRGFVLAYLTAVGRKRWLSGAVIAILTIAAAYALWAYPQTGTRPF